MEIKRGRGQPTKYTKQLQEQFDRMVDDWNFEGKGNIHNFFTLWIADQIAYRLGINQETFYEYVKKHPEFSKTKKRWQTKRNSGLGALVPMYSKNPTMWIWLSKNCLKMSEKPIDGDDGGSIDSLLHALEQSRKRRGSNV